MATTEVFIGAGSYEKYVFGYSVLIHHDSETNEIELDHTTLFAYKPHGGPIKSVSVRYPYMVTGSNDESAKVYYLPQLKERDEIKSDHQSGSVNDVAIYGKHLITVAEKGPMVIWHKYKNDFEEMGTLPGHSKGTTSFALHPSGKIALTISEYDKELKLWNLLNATCALTLALANPPISVKWSQSGESYAILFKQGKILTIFSASGEKQNTLTFEGLCSCFEFINEHLIATGLENEAAVWSINSGNRIEKLPHPDCRVKAISCATQDSGPQFLFCGTSTGQITIWALQYDKKLAAAFLMGLATHQRITCMTSQITTSMALHKKLQPTDFVLEETEALHNWEGPALGIADGEEDTALPPQSAEEDDDDDEPQQQDSAAEEEQQAEAGEQNDDEEAQQQKSAPQAEEVPQLAQQTSKNKKKRAREPSTKPQPKAPKQQTQGGKKNKKQRK